MYRRCRCHHDGDGLALIVLGILCAVVALPILGGSLLFFGDTAGKKVLGLVLLIVFGFLMICTAGW